MDPTALALRDGRESNGRSGGGTITTKCDELAVPDMLRCEKGL